MWVNMCLLMWQAQGNRAAGKHDERKRSLGRVERSTVGQGSLFAVLLPASAGGPEPGLAGRRDTPNAEAAAAREARR